ncbi:MAG: hypothetical protein MdMp014T_2240 [Treponematales bacterium]
MKALVRYALFALALSLAAVCAVFLSCNQNSIFADISNEADPKDPRIQGTPAAPVIVTGADGVRPAPSGGAILCTASLNSATVWCYYSDNAAGPAAWRTLDRQPGGVIQGLAAKGSWLYAIVGILEDSQVMRIDLSSAASTWETVNKTAVENAGYPRLQTIYAAGDKVFVGASKGTSTKDGAKDYAIFEVNGTALSDPLQTDTSLLQGAVKLGSDYYLGTAGSGVYKVNFSSSPSTSPIVKDTTDSDITGLTVMGMLNVGSAAAFVTRSGAVYSLSSSGTAANPGSVGYTATGGLEVWTNPAGGNGLLLVGVIGSDSSGTHGYREVLLSGGNLSASFSVQSPGDSSPTSVSNEAKYDASMATHPALSLIQVPAEVEAAASGAEPVIFAGTPKNGLWSYRNGEWNAEE